MNALEKARDLKRVGLAADALNALAENEYLANWCAVMTPPFGINGYDLSVSLQSKRLPTLAASSAK